MRLIDNEDFIQNFLTNGSDESFRESIGIGGAVRDANDVNSFGLKNVIKCLGEFLVIIANQGTEFIFLFLDNPDLISSLLCNPVAVRMVGDASQIDLSGANVNEKENS